MIVEAVANITDEPLIEISEQTSPDPRAGETEVLRFRVTVDDDG